MPRAPKPWYWKARKEWYVTIQGVRHRLGQDKDEAHKTFYKLMSGEIEIPTPCEQGLFDKFLDWTKEHRAEKTWRGYKDFLDSFRKKFSLTVDALKPFHVQEWLDSEKTWNSTTRRNAITAVQRALNWAVKMGYIDRNPIKGMEKPEAKTRTNIITLKEFKKLLRLVPDKEFRDLLVFCWDTGCRPFEAKKLCQRHIQDRRCVFPKEESKGKKRPRVIYLATERSVRILKRLSKEGPLFRNTLGNPWTASAVRIRFENLQEKVGKRFCQYDFRHTWITRKLIAGVDSHVVGRLAGHVDTSQIDKTYSHVSDDHTFMLENARKGA